MSVTNQKASHTLFYFIVYTIISKNYLTITLIAESNDFTI
jgi:hypothetical protein